MFCNALFAAWKDSYTSSSRFVVVVLFNRFRHVSGVLCQSRCYSALTTQMFDLHFPLCVKTGLWALCSFPAQP